MTSAQNQPKTAISTPSRSKGPKSEEKIVFSPLTPVKPLTPKSDRHQFSPDDNNTLRKRKGYEN